MRLEQRTGPVKFLGTARVDGLALRFHKRSNLDGSGKGNIVYKPNSYVCVAVFEVPHLGIEKLDECEGAGNGYERGRLFVPEYGVCMTYYAQPTHIDNSLSPFSWYKELVIAGCRFQGFQTEYIQEIEAVEAIMDPDSERHEIKSNLLPGG